MKSIDYSTWKNSRLQAYAAQVDRDGVKGLSGQEVFEFARIAKENNVNKSEIAELLGASFSQKPAQNPDFDKAAEYYNEKMDSYERSDVTDKTYNNLHAKLYEMEKAVDDAFIECDAYKDMVIIPRGYYRHYPYFNDRLINFDIEEIRNLTSKDMDSLYELKDKIEYIMEGVNGKTEHNKPSKTEYDIEALAEKHLGMSYEEFASKYSAELEFCKTVTTADFSSMTETQKTVYRKAKAYATEMLTTTINEAHTTNWDAGERKLEETTKATDDMYAISEFETEGVTEDGLKSLKSGIMYKAFEEALIAKYQELEPSGIEEVKADSKDGVKKVLINGQILIFHPDGSVYDTSGRKVK